MKKLNVITIAVLGMIMMGCAQEGAKSGTVYVPPTVTNPTSDGDNDNNQDYGAPYGSTTTFTWVSRARFESYAGHPIQTTNVSALQMQINVNLDFADPGYAGSITLSYKDANCQNGSCVASFTSGGGSTNSKYNVKYDFDHDGVTDEWHGIFEDAYGAIVVVIEKTPGFLGDGGPFVGSVYFKNFGYTGAAHPPTHCWFVYAGPYDCRPWKSGNGVNTYASLAPGNGYQLLGTFEGTDLQDAFNDTW